MRSIVIQVRRKGVITLPRELRQRYHVDAGDAFTVLDLGDGSFLLTPHVSQVAHLGDQAARVLAEEGVGVEDVIEALDQERATYYRERYAST